MSAVAATGMLGAIPAERRPAINPWIIAVTVTLATFMELLDTSHTRLTRTPTEGSHRKALV